MKSRGFSLIELLVVIAIIGLIGTLTSVSFASAKDKGRIAAGLTTSRVVYETISETSVGAWSFDECTGNDTYDSSGTTNDGWITGTANWSSDAPTKSGCSLRFNGSNYISTGKTWDVKHDNFTITAWFKTNYAGEQIMVTSGYEDLLEMENGHMHLDLSLSGSSPQGTKRVNDNKWHFVIVTGDSTSIRVYLDGSKQPDLEIPAQSDVYSGEFLIGRCGAGGNFRGYLDDVRIYQHSYSGKEVTTRFAEEIARK